MCRRFGLFIELIILIFGIAVVAFHFNRTTFSLSTTVIVSGITFFIIRELMTVYERHQEAKEIIATQLGELPECFLNQDPVEALEMKEAAATTSVSAES